MDKTFTWVIGAFTAIALILYGSLLTADFISFDDNILVTENLAVQEISAKSIVHVFSHYDPELYVPLTFLSYQLDHLIGGLNPWIFHFTNLLLHIVNAVLVVWVVSMLVKRKWAPILVGLLFLVHPLNTEAIAWIAARKDLLSSLFFLLSLGLYIKGNKPWSISLFAAGLLAKVSIITLPIVFILVDWFQNRAGKHTRAQWGGYVPYFALSLVFGIIALFGKSDVLSDATFLDGLLIATKSLTFYIQKLLLPTGLSVLYPYANEITIQSFLLPIVLFLLFLFFLLFSLYKKWRTPAFALSFFLLTLLPSFTNFTKAGDVYFASDRYAYIPSIAFFLLIALLIEKLIHRDFKVFALVSIVLALTLSSVSFARAAIWQNTETLFTDVLKKYDHSHLAHNKVGGALLEQGKELVAVEHFTRSIAIKPNARAYFNLGIVFIANEEWEAAEGSNLEALKLNPDYAPAHENLGYLYYRNNRTKQAIESYENVVRLDPMNRSAYAILNELIHNEDS